MASKRREAYERGIEEEAERQGAMAERTRNRMNELMTLGYEHAMEWLETAQPSDLRPQDVIQIAKLHLEAVKAFDVVEVPKKENWTEEDDQDLIERILPAIKGQECSEKDSGEHEVSEESEDEQPTL